MRETFVVQIVDAQNATWQGTVTWMDGKKTQPFRSALELLRLIDSTVEQRGGPRQEGGDGPEDLPSGEKPDKDL